jgi:hypothetical protein
MYTWGHTVLVGFVVLIAVVVSSQMKHLVVQWSGSQTLLDRGPVNSFAIKRGPGGSETPV